MWHRIAALLSIPVEELRNRVTFTEFLDWCEYLRWEETVHHSKLDFYLAQIASETRKSFIMEPQKVSTQDFLLKFTDGTEEADRAKKSKSAWAQALGIKLGNN